MGRCGSWILLCRIKVKRDMFSLKKLSTYKNMHVLSINCKHLHILWPVWITLDALLQSNKSYTETIVHKYVLSVLKLHVFCAHMSFCAKRLIQTERQFLYIFKYNYSFIRYSVSLSIRQWSVWITNRQTKRARSESTRSMVLINSHRWPVMSHTTQSRNRRSSNWYTRACSRIT